MKNLKLFFVLTLAISCVIMISCSKGNTGPAGPAGSDSVQYSGWTTLSMTGNIDANSDTTYTDTLTANAITSDILNKGIVVGYIRFLDALGDTTILNASTIMSESFVVGKIELFSGAPYASNSSGSDFSGYDYRYVVVPAKIATNSVSGKGQIYTSEQLKAMSYPALMHVLSIPANGSSLQLRPSN